jgi:hypothetical protein
MVHGLLAQGDADPARTAALDSLAGSGFAALAPALSAAQIDEIHAHLARLPATPAADAPGPCRVSYDVATILGCPHLVELVNQPAFLALAQSYLGCKPTISALGLRWSRAGTRPCAVERYHRDMEDWRILKIFVYLTDVDADAGPHEYVIGSHLTAGRFRLRPYAQEEVAIRYGKAGVRAVTGPRGTTFAENMWGIHRGRPGATRRLMFDVMYSTNRVPIYEYHPMPLDRPHAYDGYVNRLMFT